MKIIECRGMCHNMKFDNGLLVIQLKNYKKPFKRFLNMATSITVQHFSRSIETEYRTEKSQSNERMQLDHFEEMTVANGNLIKWNLLWLKVKFDF